MRTVAPVAHGTGVKQISLTRRNFPPPHNGLRALPYSEKSILRAAVAAGQKPWPRSRTAAAQADIDMRIAAVRSALDMSAPQLTPTPHFLASGSTDRAHKSYYVGNALCAHAAYRELRIPWLVDVEKVKWSISVRKPAGKKRPDFLGLDPSRQWYVFESKGRTSRPTAPELLRWKSQARAIKAVKGKSVVHNIVSAACLKKNEWGLLWVDPPADDGALAARGETLT
jgi:hypothetical protein